MTSLLCESTGVVEMTRSLTRWTLCTIGSFAILGTFVILVHCTSPRAAAQEVSAAAPVLFGDVKAVLRKHCGTCHNTNEMRGGLDVMSEAAIQAGADSGPVIVPGKPEESLLYLVTTHEADPKMPPNSPKIPQRELTILQRWIAGLTANSSPAAEPNAGDGKELQPSNKAPTTGNSTSLTPDPSTPVNSSDMAKIAPLASKSPIIASALHPDVQMIALAVNRQIVFLNKETRELNGAIDFPLGEVHALTYSQDGKQLIVGGGEPGASGGFIIYDLGGRVIFQWNEEFDVIQTVAISPDNSLIAAGSPKRTVRVVHTKDGTEKFVVKKHTDWLTALAFSPDGLLLASGDRFGGLYLWNVENGEEFANLKEHSGTVRGIHFSPSTDHLISASEDGFLRRFDLQSLSLDQEWNGNMGGITSMACGSVISNDAKTAQTQPLADRLAAGRILVAGRDKKVKLFDFAGNPLWEEKTAVTLIPSLAMSADAHSLFATTSSASVLCWLKDDHQLQSEIALPISAELNSQLLATISSQTPQSTDVAASSIEPVAEASVATMAEAISPASTSSSTTLAESRKILAETEDVLKRFSLITSQLESELEKQEMLRTRDLLRNRIASHRRLMQSLQEYLSEVSDSSDVKEVAATPTAEPIAQQLKITLENDLAELEMKLAKLIESMTKVDNVIESSSRQ